MTSRSSRDTTFVKLAMINGIHSTTDVHIDFHFFVPHSSTRQHLFLLSINLDPLPQSHHNISAVEFSLKFIVCHKGTTISLLSLSLSSSVLSSFLKIKLDIHSQAQIDNLYFLFCCLLISSSLWSMTKLARIIPMFRHRSAPKPKPKRTFDKRFNCASFNLQKWFLDHCVQFPHHFIAVQ